MNDFRCNRRLKRIYLTSFCHDYPARYCSSAYLFFPAPLAGTLGPGLLPLAQLEQPAQYLRQWLYNGSDQARFSQTQPDAARCFTPLLRWVLAWLPLNRPALVVDPTLKRDQATARRRCTPLAVRYPR